MDGRSGEASVPASQQTIDLWMRQGFDLHGWGDLAGAETLYRKILKAQPENFDALYLLGKLAAGSSRTREAIEFLSQAVAIKGDVASFRYALGAALLSAGDLDRAEDCLNTALRLDPAYAEAYNDLACVLQQRGRLREAEDLFRKALQANPRLPQAHFNLATVIEDQDLPEQAIDHYRCALELRPDYPQAHHRLGTALNRLGRIEEAAAAYRRALELEPDGDGAYLLLGNIYAAQGKFEDAAECYCRSLDIDDGSPEKWHRLAIVFQLEGKLAQAVDCCHKALERDPSHYDSHFVLGTIFRDQGKYEDALKEFQALVRLKPEDSQGLLAIATVHHYWAHSIEAIETYRACLRLDPNCVRAYNDLGGCLHELGRLTEAEAAFRKAMEIDPRSPVPFSNMLFSKNCQYGVDPADFFREHLDWAARFEAPVAGELRPHANDRDPQRKLRVGYISPNFSQHPVAFFVYPVFRLRDADRFETWCYSDVEVEDRVTERLKGAADRWQRVVGLSNEHLAQRIRKDGIDVLVDLAGHSAGGNRMLLFARKPAPVQVTWLGYLNTTGLAAMDYRITDAVACPPGMERYHTERLLRMPDSQWCYATPEEAPEVGPLPAPAAGHVTFGAMHQLPKVNAPVIDLWGQLMHRVPGSRLVAAARGVSGARDELIGRFGALGIAAERLEILDFLDFPKFLELHNRIDINLDAFPYTGGTTTCHSLWMGVPLVTLTGRGVMSRGGASLLSAVGLRELIADTPEAYLEVAVRLAGDLEGLGRLRAGLRERVRRSPLVDAEKFTRNLEQAYRIMWQEWCASAAKPARRGPVP
ncbi:MAG: tetratricopeptide repeat protein [Betaproteobacteria bacterium]|nr:tetratricopeptide repeat protein [Betaproteobacteria bacterium]